MAEAERNTEGAENLGTNTGPERGAIGPLRQRLRRAIAPGRAGAPERPDPATPERARGLAAAPGAGSFVAPDCYRGTCSEHRGEHVRWADCRDWTPLVPTPLQPDERLEAAPPPAANGAPPGLLGTSAPAGIAYSEVRLPWRADSALQREASPEELDPRWAAGEPFIRLPSGEDVPLERWAEEHPEGPLFEMFRETFSDLQLVAIDRLAQVRSEPETAEAQRLLQRVMDCEAQRRRANRSGTPEEQEAAAQALLAALAERGEHCRERLATSPELAKASGHPGWSAHRCCRLSPHLGEHLCTCGTAWRWSEGRADLQAALHAIRQLEPEQQRALLLDWFGPTGGRRLLAVIDSGPGAEEAFAPSSPARPL